MLHKHNKCGGLGSLADAGHGEKVEETETRLADLGHLLFSENTLVGCVDVTGGLERCVANACHGLVRVVVATLGDVPARRLGRHVDEDENKDGREGSASEHETPVETIDTRAVGHVVESNVGNIAKHDTERGPELPLHYETTADLGRDSLGSVDGNRSTFGGNTKSEEDSRDDEMPPCVGDTSPDAGCECDGAADEDSTATAKVVVPGLGDPAGEKGTAKVGSRVDDTDEPA